MSRIVTSCGVAGLLTAGCAGAPGTAGAPAAAPGVSAKKADQLYVVDCLLPAQVKRLGRSMTFLGPRRAIKTAAVDCEIRGGEYVSYDRADHATALRVWLPLAQEGDRTAQVYVGEIYERGLGVPPDYVVAASWYRKAADQGDARAQINLGHLYEKGLGVARDPVAALGWYRRASGLPELVALDGASLDDGVRREVEGLRDEVQRRTRESETLRAQLDLARRDLDQARQDLARRSGEAEAGRERLEALRRELAGLRREAEAARDDQRIRTLTTELGAARRQLDQAQQELGRRSAEAEAGRQRVEAVTRELAELRARSGRDDARVGALETELARARQELERVRQDVERRTGEARSEQGRTEELRRELERLRAQAEALGSDPRIKALEAELGRRQAELDRQTEEVARLRQRVASLQGHAEGQRAAAVRDGAAPVAGPTIEMIEPSVTATRGVSIVRVASAAERIIVGKVTAPAGLMLLTVNDREETPDANGLFRAKIPLQTAGVPVRVVAVDRQGKRGGIEFSIAPEAPGAPAPAPKKRAARAAVGQYYALIIGNNAYAHWPSLKTAEFDARRTAEILETKYGFKTRVLLNAGRYAILQALNELRNQLTEKDNLLLYYAGHGYLDEKINRAYWIPVDGHLDSNVDWIPTVAVTDLVSAMSAKQILLVVDSCYSGALTRSALARLEAGMSEEARQHWIEVMASKRSRTVLSSGDVKPVLDTGGGQHSVFARAWLDVLAKNDDVLEGQRLYREIAARVAYAADALKFEQVPQYAPIRFAGHESGDFLFVPSDR
jgi:predicted nuclease with TOPRIM domain